MRQRLLGRGADGHDERVVGEPVAAGGDGRVGGVVDRGERAADQARADVGGDPVEPLALRAAARERLGNGHRAVDELVLGGEQGARDAVAGKVSQGQAGLEAGDAAAGDQDLHRWGRHSRERIEMTNTTPAGGAVRESGPRSYGKPVAAARVWADDALRLAREAVGMTTVLVAYGSKHGSTAEIAAAIADTLREYGLEVDCTDVGEVSSLDGYDAVVLGSAVYMRRWRREARRFLHQHARELAERPLWVFSSGPVGDPAKDNPVWLEPRRTIAEAQRLGARSHVVFGGYLDSSSVPAEYRDRRDWDEIRTWAALIAAELALTAAR